ncbi:MAG: hypothetical protein JST16_05240 [Bdellovibrionales bacterium]|nr:hypothetical protein [Bdellovibrionales bacterium]
MIALSAIADDGSFGYFGHETLDFWKERVSKTDKPAPSPAVAVGTEEAFPWKKYLDPKNKEFFREGDYTPPEPFMEIVRNPSDENLKLWFQYIEKKNDLSARLQTRMAEYLHSTQAASLPIEAKEDLRLRAQKVAARSRPALDVRRYRFRMYFDSTCPHCRRMFGTLGELSGQGFFVDARQIDAGSLSGVRVTVPVERASPAEVKSRAISSVPLLLVGDLEKKVVLKITGYKSVGEIMEAIRAQDTSGAPP